MVRRITGQKIVFFKKEVETCTWQYWLLKLYKVFRFIFVTIYYYIFPFLIVIFSNLLLLYKEIGRKLADEADAPSPTVVPMQQQQQPPPPNTPPNTL